MTANSPDADTILFGRDPTERIVAVEVKDAQATYFLRDVRGDLFTEEIASTPWFLSADTIGSCPRAKRLPGEGFRYLHRFASVALWREALDKCDHLGVPRLAYGSRVKQELTLSGRTHFKGMALQDVVRMQLDIETTTLSPDAPDARLLLIAIGDNRGRYEALVGDEVEQLRRLAFLVREIDPDIIEGHNILGFDLPYLMARATRLGVRLALGRDGSSPRALPQRRQSMGSTGRPLVPYHIHGRHVIDTYLSVQRFDAVRGALRGYGLKECARAYGFSSDDRIELDRSLIAETYASDPARVLEYARQDIEETAALASLVTATDFYMTQMVPHSYEACAVGGTGSKIDAIMVRAYLAQPHAVARPQIVCGGEGGYTETRVTGIIDRVVKADFESLYPSIMLSKQIAPSTDVLGCFLPALGELTTRRLAAKRRAKEGPASERTYWDGIQNSFKILINSFYGYLGAEGFCFNDVLASAAITEEGRRLVKQVAADLEAGGSKVIEIDTDGIYFVPPEDVCDEEAERAYVARIGTDLPAGIRLAFDGRYRTMISLKTKNYVLRTYDGNITLTGASLRSRADELFGREFLAQAIALMLNRRTEEIGDLYLAMADAILAHQVPIGLLARRERVTPKTFSSTARRRTAGIAQGVAIGEYITLYERANGERALATDYVAGDENVEYYVGKLYKFALRLEEAIGPDFARLIPKPGRRGVVRTGQLSLF